MINLGVKNPSQSKKVKELKKEKSQKKFGTNCPFQSEEIKRKSKETCNNKYGVDNWSKSVEGISFYKKNTIEKIKSGLKDGKRFSPFHGKNEEPIFNEIKLHIEYKNLLKDQEIDGCWPDELINEDIKIAFELDGIDHEFEFQKEKDKRKDKVYISKGYMPIHIKESDWFEDKELQIVKVQETIKFLEQINQLRN